MTFCKRISHLPFPFAITLCTKHTISLQSVITGQKSLNYANSQMRKIKLIYKTILPQKSHRLSRLKWAT